MAKYSKAAQKKVEPASKRVKNEKLPTGKSGKKVAKTKQATAAGPGDIGKKGGKLQVKKSSAKNAATPTVAKKTAPIKTTIKKTLSITKKSKALPAKTAQENSVKTISVIKDKNVAIDNVLEEQIIPALPTDASRQDENLPPVEENSPEILREVNTKPEDPIMAIDKKALAKAVSKTDPKHPMHLSGIKRGLKPSGKKPLWR